MCEALDASRKALDATFEEPRAKSEQRKASDLPKADPCHMLASSDTAWLGPLESLNPVYIIVGIGLLAGLAVVIKLMSRGREPEYLEKVRSFVERGDYRRAGEIQFRQRNFRGIEEFTLLSQFLTDNVRSIRPPDRYIWIGGLYFLINIFE